MLKIGLIGCGYLGSRHLKHLSDIDGVELSAVWDIDLNARRKAEKEYGICPVQGLDDLFSRSDAVDIVTPTPTHCTIGLQAVSHGLPFFVEKPICATYNEGLSLLREASVKNILIQVGHIERFNRAVRSLGDTNIKPGFIEVHRLAEWNPRGTDVAVVHDLMIHDLDLILKFAGAFPDNIYASGVRVVTDSVDIANARLEFGSGLVANVTASRISLKRMRKLRLFGNNEYIALDLDKGTCDHVGVATDPADIPESAELLGEIGIGEKSRKLYLHLDRAPEGDALRLQLESFRDAIVSGAEPVVTGQDGLNALRLAEVIVHKINERR